MKILIIWFIIGLLNCAIANEKHENKHHSQRHHAGRYQGRNHITITEDEPLTLPPPTAAPLENYDGLNLIFSLERKTLAFANVSENVGFAYVVRDEGVLKLLVDAKSGTTLRYFHADNVTRIQTSTIKGQILSSFATILRLESHNGIIPEGSSQIDPSSQEALHLLSDVYLHVATKNAPRSSSLKNFGLFVDKLERLYLGPLYGILQGPSPVPLKENLNRFLSISVGLRELFTRARGGLRGILEKGVKFEVNPLYNGKNGAEVFAYILRQTGTKFNLAVIWGGLLKDIDKVLQIIQLLGGGQSLNGVDETFGFLSHIWSALSLRLPISNLVKYLLEASSEDRWSKTGDGDFSNVLKDLKNITDEQSRKYDNSGLITPFVSFFSNLTANSLIQDGVNVSDLVQKWRKRDVIGGFKSVTDILLKFTSPERYSNILFNSFLAFLNTSSDPNSLKRLFPGISLDIFKDPGSSLWNSISKAYNVDSLLKNNANSTEVLSGVPGFGEFSKIYKDSFGSPFDFTKILNGKTISDYLSQGIFAPYKWASGIFHDPGSFIKHIFWDPFKPLVSGFNHLPVFDHLPGIDTLPTVAPSEESISLHTKIVVEKETVDDNPKPTVLISENTERSTVKVFTEIKEVKVTTSAPISEISEISEDLETTTLKPSTKIVKEIKLSTQVDVEVSTESKGSADIEFRQHHQKKHHERKHHERKHHENKHHDYKHHENKHHHEVHHENKKAHHVERSHHDIKNKENHENRNHRNLRHNFGETHQNRRNDKLEVHHVHRQEKGHESHNHVNA